MVDEVRRSIGVIGLSNVLLDVEELGVADQNLKLLFLSGVGEGSVLGAAETVVFRAESGDIWLGGLGGWLMKARCMAVSIGTECSSGG